MLQRLSAPAPPRIFAKGLGEAGGQIVDLDALKRRAGLAPALF